MCVANQICADARPADLSTWVVSRGRHLTRVRFSRRIPPTGVWENCVVRRKSRDSVYRNDTTAASDDGRQVVGIESLQKSTLNQSAVFVIRQLSYIYTTVDIVLSYDSAGFVN